MFRFNSAVLCPCRSFPKMQWRNYCSKWRSRNWSMKRRPWSPCRRPHGRKRRRSARLKRCRSNIFLSTWGINNDRFLCILFFWCSHPKVCCNTVSINIEDALYCCLQEVLITARADTLRWQRLYEELKLSSGQIREQQHLSDQQLQQLRSQSEVRYTVAAWMIRSPNICEKCASCAAFQGQRGWAEGGGGGAKTREEGAAVQRLPAGRRPADFKRWNTAN